MITCPKCKSLTHENAVECPACDHRLKPRSLMWLLAPVLLVVAAVIAVLALR